MPDNPKPVFFTRTREGTPRGDLFELEQRNWTDVIDDRDGRVVMSFNTLMEASLDSDTGLWSDYHWSGAREVLIAEDERSVSVIFYDGRVEVYPLPLD